MWATSLVPIGLRLVWYTLPGRPRQCTLRAIESAPSQSWPIWHAPCWAHQVLALWHMYVRTAESAAPSGVSQGTSKREIRSCAIRDRPSAWQSGPSLFQQRPAHVHRSFRLVRMRVGHGTCAWIRVAAGTDKSSLWQGSGRLPLRPVRGLSALCRRLAAKSGARI